LFHFACSSSPRRHSKPAAAVAQSLAALVPYFPSSFTSYSYPSSAAIIAVEAAPLADDQLSSAEIENELPDLAGDDVSR
jgi:hypothetical protein